MRRNQARRVFDKAEGSVPDMVQLRLGGVFVGARGGRLSVSGESPLNQ